MKKRVILVILILICIAFIFLFHAKILSKTTENKVNFYQVVEQVKVSFSYQDYEEQMGDKSHVLSQPIEKTLVDERENFIAAQKLFVYKSKTKNAIILLQITLSALRINEWRSSIDYSPELFNSEGSKYGNEYNYLIPDIRIGHQAFSYNGCNYDIIAISPIGEATDAATEAVQFTNELVRYLTKTRLDGKGE